MLILTKMKTCAKTLKTTTECMEQIIFLENESKNKLQQFFQKKALSLPIYETKTIIDTNYKFPIFVSTVTLHDGSKYQGEERTTIKSSEFSAATKALEILKSESVSTEKNIEMRELSCEKRNIIIIDIENLHNFHKSLTHKEFELFDVYAFVGVRHHLVNIKLDDNIHKIISPSTRPDGTGTCIQVFTGLCLAQNLYDNYFIATRDKFGSALVDMIMGEGLLWNPKKAQVVTDISQVYCLDKH